MWSPGSLKTSHSWRCVEVGEGVVFYLVITDFVAIDSFVTSPCTCHLHLHFITLCSTLLHSSTLTALLHTPLHCTVPFSTFSCSYILYCILLFTLHCLPLHSSTFHNILLHSITLHHLLHTPPHTFTPQLHLSPLYHTPPHSISALECVGVCRSVWECVGV
jgi:hypothetical protein